MKSLLSKGTKFPGILIVFLFLAFGSGCQKSSIETGDTLISDSQPTQFISKELSNFIVITKSETLPEGFEKQLSAYGEIIRSMPEIGEVVIKPKVSNFEAKVSKLSQVQAVVPDLQVKWIEPDKFISEANPPGIGDNEPLFLYQWGLDAINAPEAWNAGFKGKNAKVFILDSGIDAEHPDLAPNLNTGLCASFVDGEDFNVKDGFYFNHGTHVAGIIAAADNSLGIIGVAPGAEIIAVKVVSEYTGSGSFSQINKGIVYAANKGADVINMSLGATLFRNGLYFDENDVLRKVPAVYIQSLILSQQRAVNYASRRGAVIVTSAGNEGMNYDGNAFIFKIPAELQNVVAVSATAPNYWYNDWINQKDPYLDIPSSYIDYGKSLVDIAAPGGDFDYYELLNWHLDMVFSTISEGYGWAAGTSMASPHVAGVAALIIGKNNGEMDPGEVMKQLLKTSDKIDGNGMSAYFGSGRVNAFRAVTE
jgi:subtilisin family serine protease